MRKEQNLDSNRQPEMQSQHDKQQHLARLSVCRAQHGEEIAQQEEYRYAEADAHKDPVEDGDGRPADQRHGDPDQVGVPV